MGSDIRAEPPPDKKSIFEKSTLYCSFCGKSQHEVDKLIAGPTVFICSECITLCMDILFEVNRAGQTPAYVERVDPPLEGAIDRVFMTPSELLAKLSVLAEKGKFEDNVALARAMFQLACWLPAKPAA